MSFSEPIPPKLPSLNVIKYGVYALIAFIIFSVLSSTTFLTIEPGRAGVLFNVNSG